MEAQMEIFRAYASPHAARACINSQMAAHLACLRGSIPVAVQTRKWSDQTTVEAAPRQLQPLSPSTRKAQQLPKFGASLDTPAREPRSEGCATYGCCTLSLLVRSSASAVCSLPRLTDHSLLAGPRRLTTHHFLLAVMAETITIINNSGKIISTVGLFAGVTRDVWWQLLTDAGQTTAGHLQGRKGRLP